MRRILLLVATGLLAVTTAGCLPSGLAPESTGTATANASASATAGGAPRPVTARCPADPPSAAAKAARPLTFGSAGARLYGAELGSGPRGVVLVHQVGTEGLCMWLDRAAYLARHGYHVLAFDQRCYGDSTCPDGLNLDVDAIRAAATLRARGAKQVVAVGASQGATVTVVAAGHDRTAFDGVVALSGDLTSDGYTRTAPRTGADAAPRVTAPILYAVARDDSVLSVAATRRIERRTGSREKRFVALPASAGHGIETLADVDGHPSRFCREVVLPFLRAHTR